MDLFDRMQLVLPPLSLAATYFAMVLTKCRNRDADTIIIAGIAAFIWTIISLLIISSLCWLLTGNPQWWMPRAMWEAAIPAHNVKSSLLTPAPTITIENSKFQNGLILQPSTNVYGTAGTSGTSYTATVPAETCIYSNTGQIAGGVSWSSSFPLCQR